MSAGTQQNQRFTYNTTSKSYVSERAEFITSLNTYLVILDTSFSMQSIALVLTTKLSTTNWKEYAETHKKRTYIIYNQKWT